MCHFGFSKPQSFDSLLKWHSKNRSWGHQQLDRLHGRNVDLVRWKIYLVRWKTHLGMESNLPTLEERHDMGVNPKIGGKPPKWMVKIMENPISMDDLGVPAESVISRSWICGFSELLRTNTCKRRSSGIASLDCSWCWHVLAIWNTKLNKYNQHVLLRLSLSSCLLKTNSSRKCPFQSSGNSTIGASSEKE